MTWRVRVATDAIIDGISIQIADATEGGPVRQVRFTQASEIIEPGTQVPEPSLTLPDGLALVLLRALAEHYGQSAPAVHDRADLLHERGRVDRLISHLLGGGA